jgi:hypothetical protein
VRDGVDIFITVISYENNYIDYVRANSPIVLIHDDKLQFSQGSKQSLGSSPDDFKPFKSQRVEYLLGDVLCLFTDVYQD